MQRVILCVRAVDWIRRRRSVCGGYMSVFCADCLPWRGGGLGGLVKGFSLGEF